MLSPSAGDGQCFGGGQCFRPLVEGEGKSQHLETN